MRRASAALLAALPLVSQVAGDSGDSSTKPMVTTAPIFVPQYDQMQWSVLRGSIITSDRTATTYTIFCPTGTADSCSLSLEFPFIIVEGPGTLQFHGTLTSTYIADLECKMNSTTRAVCSGYSSYRSGYTNGKYSGPTEVSWTSTYTGSDAQWGTLTLTDAPATTDTSLEATGSNVVGPSVVSSSLSSSPTSSIGASTQPGKWCTMALALWTLVYGLL